MLLSVSSPSPYPQVSQYLLFRSCVPGTLLHLLLSTFLWAPAYYAKLWSPESRTLVPQLAGTALDKFGFMTGAGEGRGGGDLLAEGLGFYATCNCSIRADKKLALLRLL
jgi:hypothetical protein